MDVTTQRVLRRLAAKDVVSVSFATDGRLAVGLFDQTVHIWDESQSRLIATLRGNSGAIDAIAFSQSGEVVATSDNKNVRLWQSERGRELLHLPGLEFGTVRVTNGRIIMAGVAGLLTARQRDVVTVWPCEVCGSPDDLLDLAHRRTPRRLTSAERQRFLPGG